MDRNNEIATRLGKIEDELRKILPAQPDADWAERVFGFAAGGLYAPAAGFQDAPDSAALLAPLLELVSRGGKRWRPLLACLVCEALGGGDNALPLSPLVELCHTASLIHDDIEDNSAERRGKAAVHLLYGADTAINSACFLYFLPLICIDSLETNARFRLHLANLWAFHLRRLHLGQSMDINWHKQRDFVPPIDHYYTMCSLKTGVLARFAAELGCLCVNIANEGHGRGCAHGSGHGGFGRGEGGGTDNALAAAAEKLGVGFQILDDVRNLAGGISGKERGDDLVEGKMSLPVLMYLWGVAGQSPAEGATPKAAKRVRENVSPDLGVLWGYRAPLGEGEGGNEVPPRGRLPPPDAKRHAFVLRCFDAARLQGVGAPETAELIGELETSGALAAARARGEEILQEAAAAFTALPPLPAAIHGAARQQAEIARPLLAGFVKLMLGE